MSGRKKSIPQDAPSGSNELDARALISPGAGSANRRSLRGKKPGRQTMVRSIADEEEEIRAAIRVRAPAFLRRQKAAAEFAKSFMESPPPADATEKAARLELLKDILEPKLDWNKTLLDPKYGYVTLMFGTGDCSQLGILKTTELHDYHQATETLESRRPRPNVDLINVPTIQVACGGLHNLALRATGRVYSWGTNDKGALGRESDGEFVAKPVDPPEGGSHDDMGVITRVACGDSQSLALGVDGRVWAWGAYLYDGNEFRDIVETEGKGGTGAKDKQLRGRHKAPVLVKGLGKDRELVDEIACGDNFNVARTISGKIYTWGVNSTGELGREPFSAKDEKGNFKYDLVWSDWMTPRLPAWADGISRKVDTIACGANHFLAVTCAAQADNGYSCVFSCGLNNYGQLGLGDTKNRQALTKIEALEGCNIRKIAAGNFFSLCVDVDGFLFAFGAGGQAQLGVCIKTPDKYFLMKRPVRVSLNDDNVPLEEQDRVRDLACGGTHSLVITTKGDVYTWGYGDMAALGHGATVDEIRPRKLDFNKAPLFDGAKIHPVGIAGGGQHSAILCQVTRDTK